MKNQRTDSKYFTIILSDAPPVRINSDKWPVIASGRYDHEDNHWRLTARRHEDCRAIVYGEKQWKELFNEQEHHPKAGKLLPQPDSMEKQSYDIASKIREVGEALSLPDHFIQECIASMAPVDLD
jgi:hypothetical protein